MTGKRVRVPGGKAALILVILVVSLGLALTITPAAVAGSGAGYVWVQQAPGPAGDHINATCALATDNVWSVGNYGSVFRWNGSILSKSTAGTTSNLYDISAVTYFSQNRAWAVGEGGVIRYYNGSSWVGQDSPDLGFSYDLYAVSAVQISWNSYRAWAVGTTDGFHNAIILYYNGSTWSVDENYSTGQFCDVQALYSGGSTYVWAVGSDTVNHGRVMFSNGNGTWSSRNTDYALLSLAAADTTNLYGVEWDGTVLKSTDGGSNWNALFNDWWPSGICAYDTNNVWVVGWEGNMSRSTNGGTSWTDVSSSGRDLYCVAAASTTYIFPGGEGRYLTTSNGTSTPPTWTSRTYGTTRTQNAVNGYKPGIDVTAYSVGENDSTYYNAQMTTDGGSTWSSVNPGTSSTLYGVAAVDDSNAWVCFNRYIYHYDGSGWSQAYSRNETFYCISAAASNRVWAGSSGQRIHYYNGSGWTRSNSLGGAVYGISAADTNNVYAVGSGGRIWYTSSGGTSFTSQTSGTTRTLRAVSAPDSSTAWAVGDNGTIRYTNNSGSSWSGQTSGVSVTLRGVAAIDASHAFAVGDSGTILYTDDAGATWTAQTSPVTTDLNAVWAYDANNIWAVGDGGVILFADPPYVKAVSPRYAAPGTTVDEAVVYGGYTNFDWHNSVIDMGNGVTAVPVDNLNNSTTWMACRITVDPGAALGPRTVGVTTGAEVAVPLVGGFVVGDQPTITSVSPVAGAKGDTINVEITGSATSFNKNSSPQFGAGITVNSVTYNGPDKVFANITIAGDAATGTRNVNVITGTEVPMALTGGFTVLEKPKVNNVSPGLGDPGDTVTITGSGFGADRSYLGGRTVSLVEFNGVPGAEYPVWTDNRIVCKTPENVESGPVVVKNLGGSSNSNKSFNLKPDNSCWYLAEGTNAWGFKTYITITNPNPDEVTAQITYMTPDGPVGRAPLKLDAESQTTIAPSNDLPYETDFSTRVECVEDKDIAVDRTMWWTGEGAPSSEAHNSIGVTAPSTTWDLAEGCSAYGFETWLLIQNPNNSEAVCQVTYMTEGSGAKTVEKKVPANSRQSFNMETDIGQQNSSMNVTSDIPVICERSMYRNNRKEGHDSIGVTAPSTRFYLGEGTTAWGFTTYVLIQNPAAGEATVNITYMTADGPVEQEPMTVPGNSRTTVRVNDALYPTDFSTRITANKPVVAERAMYWGAGTALGEACHETIGVSSPHSVFYLPDGQSSDGRETWTLVQNPNNRPVQVKIDYLTPAGVDNVSFTATIPTNSRVSFNMADKLPSERASIVVTSLTAGKKIVAERAMYWNNRGAGTSTIGAFTDL